MRILVAGGAGYIGSKLVPKLLDRGYDVSVIDLFWFGDHLPSGVKKYKDDLFKIKWMRGYDQVIFLAGLSNDPMADFSPQQNFIQNAAAPAYLAYIAKKGGVKRFIFASSCSVYGYTNNESEVEDSYVCPSYPYGISKVQGEQALLRMIDEGFSVICLRQGTVSGYSPRMRLDLVVNTMFKCAMEGVITVNNPVIWRPVLSIDDAVQAYIKSVEADRSVSGIFNIASGNYTIMAVADLVREAIKTHITKQDVELIINHNPDCRNYKVNTNKAMYYLDFSPSCGISDIVIQLFKNLERFEDFSNSNYYNIEVFKKIMAVSK